MFGYFRNLSTFAAEEFRLSTFQLVRFLTCTELDAIVVAVTWALGSRAEPSRLPFQFCFALGALRDKSHNDVNSQPQVMGSFTFLFCFARCPPVEADSLALCCSALPARYLSLLGLPSLCRFCPLKPLMLVTKLAFQYLIFCL